MEKLILNRLRIVLAEKDKTNRWLADKLGINENTVSKWTNNNQQPTVLTFYKISLILQVDFKDLFESNAHLLKK
jgi:transcriptional regulator with XRE-family HTH domain